LQSPAFLEVQVCSFGVSPYILEDLGLSDVKPVVLDKVQLLVEGGEQTRRLAT